MAQAEKKLHHVKQLLIMTEEIQYFQQKLPQAAGDPGVNVTQAELGLDGLEEPEAAEGLLGNPQQDGQEEQVTLHLFHLP